MHSLMYSTAPISIGSKVLVTSHTIVLTYKINEFIDKLAYDSERWLIFRQTNRLAAFYRVDIANITT